MFGPQAVRGLVIWFGSCQKDVEKELAALSVGHEFHVYSTGNGP